MQILSKTRMGAVNRGRRTSQPRFVQPDTLLVRSGPSRASSSDQANNRSWKFREGWPRQPAGHSLEASGDYFNSGDLAYQLQEIIRATAELFKKSQRIKR